MKEIKTHYDNLKVSEDAPIEVIRAAYKSLSNKHHPDKHHKSPESERIMKIINQAYSVLSDPEKRKQHDDWIDEQRSFDQYNEEYTNNSDIINDNLSPLDSIPYKKIFLMLMFSVFFAITFAQLRNNNIVGFDILYKSSLLITFAYAALISSWLDDNERNISIFYTLAALFICGALSVALSLALLYPLWNDIAYEEVTRGWWIFSYTETVPKNNLFYLLDKKSMIAGPVEELAKLMAVLFILKNKLVSKKTTLFYVIFCALGFAMLENIHYFMKYDEILWIRANPAHVVFSAIWGVALGAYLMKEEPFSYFLLMLFLGMVLHASWNLFTTTYPNIFSYFFAMVSVGGLIFIKEKLSEY